MIPEKITITCKEDLGNNKVSIIKAIRTLTGLGLKEAKDVSERQEPQTFTVAKYIGYQQTDQMYEHTFNDQCSILRSCGVIVGDGGSLIVEELRKLGIQALEQQEDELANEIMQLVLAEKFRRSAGPGQ